MTNKEKAEMVCQLRYDGWSYARIARKMGETKAECYRFYRLDTRIRVVMRCKTCGGSWLEWKRAGSKEMFDCCSSCATVKWAQMLVLEREEARVGIC